MRVFADPRKVSQCRLQCNMQSLPRENCTTQGRNQCNNNYLHNLMAKRALPPLSGGSLVYFTGTSVQDSNHRGPASAATGLRTLYIHTTLPIHCSIVVPCIITAVCIEIWTRIFLHYLFMFDIPKYGIQVSSSVRDILTARYFESPLDPYLGISIMNS